MRKNIHLALGLDFFFPHTSVHSILIPETNHSPIVVCLGEFAEIRNSVAVALVQKDKITR